MKRIVSMFNPSGLTRKSLTEGGDADGEIDDPKMMQAMAEMEREMAGMDEENRDSRKLARLIRRMSSITGESLPEDMEEMIGRMEAGEDLDALEEEFGDMEMADDLPGGGIGKGGDGEKTTDYGDDSTGFATRAAPSKTLEQRIALLRKAKGEPPRRSETIYELEDYL